MLLLLAEQHLVHKLVGSLLHLLSHLSLSSLLEFLVKMGEFDAFQGVVLEAFSWKLVYRMVFASFCERRVLVAPSRGLGSC